MTLAGTKQVKATRKVKKFSWTVVPSQVTGELLSAVYSGAKDDAAVGQLKTLDQAGLAKQAERVFGPSGISKLRWDVATPVLRQVWLPRVPDSDLIGFARMTQLELSGPPRSERIVTRADAQAFVSRRRATLTFKTNLMKLFTSLNKDERRVVVPAPPPPPAPGTSMSAVLTGQGSKDARIPYPHQESAWEKLDHLQARPGRRAGLLVLPTGAGKTYTMVVWLLRQLCKKPELRVLWIADQQELVEQAGQVFRELAPTMPRGTTKRIRVLHGAADSVAHLGTSTLDIACVTRQSLIGAQFNQGAQKRLATYLQRPTVVVVDEAHHSVAPQYHQLLDFMEQHTAHATFVGLTATPWPAGSGMTRRLHSRFDTNVANVQVRDLVKSGILAIPVIHTFNTDVFVSLTADEISRIARQDVPGDVLKKLDQEPRTRMIVRTWVARREEWDKTLVFAPTIESADHLGYAFREAGVRTWVVHTKAEVPRREAIQQFRETSGPSVLVSVGMLREGVDLPDAKTAFLARPTTSRILMRQMIGRVLRGPKAGGDAYANVVDLRDRWGADVDVLAPSELPDLEAVHEDPTKPELRLPPILDEVTQEPISEQVLRRIEAAYEELLRAALPHAEALSSTRLLGFYDLGDANVPVFEHCHEAWEQLIKGALGGMKARGPHRELFDDCPIPRPAERDVLSVVTFCRSHQTEPPLVEVRASFSVRAVAVELTEQPAMTEAEKHAWLHDKWASSLARTAFPSYQGFYEEVTREIFLLATGVTKNDPERWPVGVQAAASPLPPLQEDDRDLQPIFRATVAKGRDLLVGETEYRSLLTVDALPRYEWTKTRPRGLWAYWAPRIAGRNKSDPVIRVSRILKAHPTLVPDGLIEAVLWHELCHHLLPGRGHDAEFRRLESLWPDFVEQDARLEVLHEQFDLMANPPKSKPGGSEPATPSRSRMLTS